MSATSEQLNAQATQLREIMDFFQIDSAGNQPGELRERGGNVVAAAPSHLLEG